MCGNKVLLVVYDTRVAAPWRLPHPLFGIRKSIGKGISGRTIFAWQYMGNGRQSVVPLVAEDVK